MGGAFLRGHRHPWLAGRPGGASARGRWQGQLADQPDPARPHARSELLCAGGDADALRYGYAQEQPDAISDANAVAFRLGVHVGNRCGLRLGDSMPIADRHGDAVTIAKR